MSSPQTPSRNRTPATTPRRCRTPSTPIHSRTPPAAHNRGSMLSPGLLSPPANRPGSASSFSSFNSGVTTPVRTTSPTVIIASISSLQDTIRSILDKAISGATPSPNGVLAGAGAAEGKQDQRSIPAVKTDDQVNGGDTKPRKHWEVPTAAWNKLTSPLVNIDRRITSIVKPFAHFLQVLERHESAGQEGKTKIGVIEKKYPKTLSRRNRRRLLLQLVNTFQPLIRDLQRRLILAGDYLIGLIPEGDEDDQPSVTIQKVRELAQCLETAAEEVVAFCQSDGVQKVIDIMNTAAEDKRALSPPPTPVIKSPRRKKDGKEGSPTLGPVPKEVTEPHPPSEENPTDNTTHDEPTPPVVELEDADMSTGYVSCSFSAFSSQDESSSCDESSKSPSPDKLWREKCRVKLPNLPLEVAGTDRPAPFLLNWCAPENTIRKRAAVRGRVKPGYTEETGKWFLEDEKVKAWLDGARGPIESKPPQEKEDKGNDAVDDEVNGLPPPPPPPTWISEFEDTDKSEAANEWKDEYAQRVLLVQGSEFTGKTTLGVRLYDHLNQLGKNQSSDTKSSTTRTIFSICHEFDRRYWGRQTDSSAVGNILGQAARQLAEQDPEDLLRLVGDAVEMNPQLSMNTVEALHGRKKEIPEELLRSMVRNLQHAVVVYEPRSYEDNEAENGKVEGMVYRKWHDAISTVNVVMMVRPMTKPSILRESIRSLLNLSTKRLEVRICVIGPLASEYQSEDLFEQFPESWPRMVIKPDRKEVMRSAMHMAEWFEEEEDALEEEEAQWLKRDRKRRRPKRWRGPLSKLRLPFFRKRKDGRTTVNIDDMQPVKGIGLGSGFYDISEISEEGPLPLAWSARLTEPEATELIGAIRLTKSVERWGELYKFIADQDNPSYFKAFLQVRYFIAKAVLPPSDLDSLLHWAWSEYMAYLQPSSREAGADILLWTVQKSVMIELPDFGIVDILSQTTGSHLDRSERELIAREFYKNFYPSRASVYSSIQRILVKFAQRVFGITPQEVSYRLADRKISYFLHTAESMPYTSYDLFVSGRVRHEIGLSDTLVCDGLLNCLEEAIPAMGDDETSRFRELKWMWSRLENNRKAYEYYIWVKGEWQERFVVGGVRATLLHLAARNGNEKIMEMLLGGMSPGDVDATSGNDWTALHLAAEMGHVKIVEMLLADGANFEANTGGRIMKTSGAFGQTASTLAAVEGHDQVVKLLIEAHVKHVKILDEAEEQLALANKPTATVEETTPPVGAEEISATEAKEKAQERIVLAEDVVTISPRPPEPTVGKLISNAREGIEAVGSAETPKDARWKVLYSENRVIIWSGAVNGRENILLNLYEDLASRNLIDAKFTRVSAFLGAVRYGHYNLVRILLEWDPRMAKTPFEQWDGTTCLHLAVYHPRVLQFLLKNGARAVVNQADDTGRTPLDQAIKAEMERSVELLLDAGADVRVANHQGQSSALTLAARSGYEPVLRLLLSRCADDFKKYSNDKRGPIHMSAFSGCIKAIEMLVEYGFDPTIKDDSGCYVPEAAALGGQVEALKFIWDQKYCAKEPNARYQPGNTTLLHLAVENGNSNPEMIKFLLANGADINVADDNGRTPLHAALLRDDLTIAALLMHKGAKADAGEKPALCVAAALGKSEMVRLMLRLGADINCTDCQGSTAISLAGMGAKGNPEMVRELIEAGADIEKPDHLGRTPLNYFASVGLVAIDCVAALLEAGADTGALDNVENSPLHRAVSSGGLPLVQLLLKHGADPNITTLTDRYTPLHVACQKGQLSCVLALLHAGANVDPVTENTREAPIHAASYAGCPDIVRVLLAHGADPDRRCNSDSLSAPLHDAAMNGFARVVQELLDGGADVGMYSKYSTALHYATRHADVVRILLDRGADVHARETDQDGDTVLHVAVIRADDPEIIRMLLEAGADIEARNSKGLTPLMMAVTRNRGMAARTLLGAGADVDAREGGATAMMLAVRKNDRRMVRLLRRWGARGA